MSRNGNPVILAWYSAWFHSNWTNIDPIANLKMADEIGQQSEHFTYRSCCNIMRTQIINWSQSCRNWVIESQSSSNPSLNPVGRDVFCGRAQPGPFSPVPNSDHSQIARNCCKQWWGLLQIATLSRLLDRFPSSWSVSSLLRMLNQMLQGFLPSFRRLQQGQYVILLVWWMARRGIDLRSNSRATEATVVSLDSVSERHIWSL